MVGGKRWEHQQKKLHWLWGGLTPGLKIKTLPTYSKNETKIQNKSI
jgi:hypothetical protein